VGFSGTGRDYRQLIAGRQQQRQHIHAEWNVDVFIISVRRLWRHRPRPVNDLQTGSQGTSAGHLHDAGRYPSGPQEGPKRHWSRVAGYTSGTQEFAFQTLSSRLGGHRWTTKVSSRSPDAHAAVIPRQPFENGHSLRRRTANEWMPKPILAAI